MRAVAVVLATFWVFVNGAVAGASGAYTRHSTGAQTIRGTAGGVTSHGFTLLSPSKGSLTVTVTKDTEYVEKGSKGKVVVRNGDHVGVRGFLHGRTILAMTVRVYPSHAAPKPYSVRGIVVSATSSGLEIRVGSSLVHAQVTASTTIRVGSKDGHVSDIKPGDKVQVRLVGARCCPSAQHIHVYRHKVVLHHVELKGTIVTVGGGEAVVLSGGKRYAVRLTSGTTVYLGRNRAGPKDLKVGATVRVYACCAGAPLTATSVHVAVTRPVSKTVLVHGSVVSATTSALTLASGSSQTRVALRPSTRVELGNSRVAPTSVRVADYVSVRGVVENGTLVASTVHIFAEYRQTHSLRGTVVSVTGTTLTLKTRGRRVSITISSGTPVRVGSTRSRITGLHAGDHVKVTARTLAPGRYTAADIAVVPVVVKVTTVHGVVTAVRGGEVDVTDAHGRHWRLMSGHGARISLRSSAAPPAALFPGESVTARGTMKGGSVVLSTLVLHLTVRDVTGRVESVSGGVLRLHAGAGTPLTILTPPTTPLRDGGKSVPVASLHGGAFVTVHLFEATPKLMRAASLTIAHPALDVAAVVRSTSPRVAVRTTAGDAFVLIVGSGTRIVTARTALPLEQSDIPVKAHVHVHGVVTSDGSVRVNLLTVTLKSDEIRGALDTISADALRVHTASGEVQGKILGATTFLQGSRTLEATGLVVGDDVTLEGYDTGPGKLIARRVLVHRRLIGIDGQIGALIPQGFVLNAADGPHGVLVTDTVVWTGGTASALAVGLSVHVTGYLRGDGSIIATRVRVGKAT